MCGAAGVCQPFGPPTVYMAPHQAALCGLTECEICIDFDGRVGRDRRDFGRIGRTNLAGFKLVCAMFNYSVRQITTFELLGLNLKHLIRHWAFGTAV